MPEPQTSLDVADMELFSDGSPESALVPPNTSGITRLTADAWGGLPVLSLTSAVGIFLVALAGAAGRAGSRWADLLFWLGLFVLFLPITLRLVSAKPARGERIALLVVLGSALYLVRDLNYPLSFAYNDEFIHWREAQDIAASGHLFAANPLLTVGPFYPGLEILTNALSSLTGLTIFISGMIVDGVAGLLLVLVLYLFFEYLGGSARLAGIATLLYAGNPNFFGNTGFSYESLAVPLAAFVLFAIARRSYTPAGHRLGLTLAIWLGLAAVVITHHVTSYVLVAFLLLWTVTFHFLRMMESFHRVHDQKHPEGPGGVYRERFLSRIPFTSRSRSRIVQSSPSTSQTVSQEIVPPYSTLANPGGAALLGLVLCVVWLKYTGSTGLTYLIVYPASTVSQLVHVFTGEHASRQLFHDGSGFVEPLWERVIAFASVGIITLGLPFGVFQIWRHYRANAVALALTIGAVAYPVSQLLRLVPAGTTTGARAQAYLSVSVVLAVGVTYVWLFRLPKRWYSVVLAPAMAVIYIAVIFIGGWISATSPLWYRLPGPYLPSADHRSIEPESVAAAEWARSYLGPGHRMIGDITNMLLMATVGDEWIVTAANSEIIVSPVFLSQRFDPGVERALQRGRVQYIVVDRRLSTGLPRGGYYYDTAEPNRGRYTSPIDPAALAKFDGPQKVSRVFDSGDIVIYDVKAIANAPSTALAPQTSCIPTPSAAVSTSYPKIASHYIGTVYDISTDLCTAMSLTGIQNQQGKLRGSFTGLNETGTFQGSVTPNGHIQFVITGQARQALWTFDGFIQPDGTVAGSFCHSLAGVCSSYGLWSLSPLESFS
jgi:hypothetical protein